MVPILAAYPVALAETVYITATWIVAGKWEALQYLPAILTSRIVYATALIVGGCRWLLRHRGEAGARPRWR